jgi:hypothetical protein
MLYLSEPTRVTPKEEVGLKHWNIQPLQLTVVPPGNVKENKQ